MMNKRFNSSSRVTEYNQDIYVKKINLISLSSFRHNVNWYYLYNNAANILSNSFRENREQTKHIFYSFFPKLFFFSSAGVKGSKIVIP